MPCVRNITICLILLAACCVRPDAVWAQGKQSVSLHYGITIPTGGGFIDGAGFADLTAEYGVGLSSTLGAGISAGYGYDRRRGHTTDRYDDDLVSGFSDRNLTVIPVQAWLRFFPWGQRMRWQPYLMFGAGVQYARFDIRGDQIDARTTSDWAVSVSPQLGSRFFPRAGKKLYLDGRIAWRHSENEWRVMDVNSIQRFCVSLGVGAAF